MSAADWATVFMLSCIGFAVGLVALFAVGLYVAARHPAEYDPARTARRFTAPALIAACVAVLSLACALVSFVGVLVAALIS